jgi:hypothetical protein
MIRKYDPLTGDDISFLKDFVKSHYYTVVKKHLDKRLKEMNEQLLQTKEIGIIDQMASLQSFIYGIANYDRPEATADDTE